MKERKSRKIPLIMLSILLVFSLLMGCAQTESVQYTPGTYKGSAMGMMGYVNVETTFSEDKIESVKILSHAETNSLAELPFEIIPRDIVEYQSLNIDVVSGATFSSFAVKNAVADCVEQAGGDVSALWEVDPPAVEPASSETKVITTDIVIVGAGGAGLAAAVSAGESGAELVVLEKTPFIGGAAALSSGGFNVAESRIQKEQGIPDTVETFIQDVYVRGGKQGDRELISIMCTEAVSVFDWLESYGLEFSEKLSDGHGDHSYYRSHMPVVPANYPYKLGKMYTDLLAKIAVDDFGAQIMRSTKGTDLIVEDGKVVGINAENTINGQKYEIRANSVILATGGFAGNPDMARSYDKTIPDKADYYAPSASSGDGIIMAQKLGADVADMDQIKSILSRQGVTRDVTNAIFVNESGKRFHDETDSGQNIIAPFDAQENGHAYMIYDSLTVGEQTPKVEGMLKSRTLFAADTLEELAEKIGVDADGLVQSVAEFNKIVNGESQDPYGRTKFSKTIATPPFYAAERHVQVHYTMGGIRINKDVQVLDTDGNPVPGLYAAGETTGGVHGGYRLGMNALTDCLVFGRKAGMNAASGLAQ